jgi:hypothetical protein
VLPLLDFDPKPSLGDLQRPLLVGRHEQRDELVDAGFDRIREGRGEGLEVPRSSRRPPACAPAVRLHQDDPSLGVAQGEPHRRTVRVTPEADDEAELGVVALTKL